MIQVGLHLFKQNFKFSAAHFLIFDKDKAERLHGHNYQVTLEVYSDQTQAILTNGLMVDFSFLKKTVKDLVDEWDEMVLLPQNQPEMRFQEEGTQLKVWFRERYYEFPKNEVLLLPIINTSVECMAHLFAEKLKNRVSFKDLGVTQFLVKIDESPGQGAQVLFQTELTNS